MNSSQYDTYYFFSQWGGVILKNCNCHGQLIQFKTDEAFTVYLPGETVEDLRDDEALLTAVREGFKKIENMLPWYQSPCKV